MASLRVPAPTPVPTSTLAKRRSFHMPLSRHGMPKAPRALSPERPHRFSAIVLPHSPSGSSPMTPLSPGPMSPPMSAKSFGTFIDSAPSTPAYSPRDLGGEWCSSQITILRPMSSSSLPSSPTEPSWEMMAPAKQPTTVEASESRAIVRPELSTASSTPLALSKPVKRTKPAIPVRATTTDIPKIGRFSSEEEALRKQAEAQARMLVEAEETSATSATTVIAASTPVPKTQEFGDNVQPEPSPKADTAPLGKLATRMKSLLRRNTSEKKKEKKLKPQQEFISLDDTHWTEM